MTAGIVPHNPEDKGKPIAAAEKQAASYQEAGMKSFSFSSFVSSLDRRLDFAALHTSFFFFKIEMNSE